MASCITCSVGICARESVREQYTDTNYHEQDTRCQRIIDFYLYVVVRFNLRIHRRIACSTYCGNLDYGI